MGSISQYLDVTFKGKVMKMDSEKEEKSARFEIEGNKEAEAPKVGDST